MEFTLPEEPVDGYTLTWYEWSAGSYPSSFTLYQGKAVYHKNTKWKDHDPARPWGLDIVNQWMVTYSNSSGGYRVNGWNTPFLNPNEYKETFATEEEARANACNWVEKQVDKARKEAEEWMELLKSLV